MTCATNPDTIHFNKDEHKMQIYTEIGTFEIEKNPDDGSITLRNIKTKTIFTIQGPKNSDFGKVVDMSYSGNYLFATSVDDRDMLEIFTYKLKPGQFSLDSIATTGLTKADPLSISVLNDDAFSIAYTQNETKNFV